MIDFELTPKGYAKNNSRDLNLFGTRNKYLKRYNQLSEKDDPNTAISIFSQNRIELKREFDSLKKEMDEALDRILNFISLKGGEKFEIKKESIIVNWSLGDTFGSIGSTKMFDVAKYELEKELKDFSKASEKNYSNYIKKNVTNIYRIKENLETIYIHRDAIEFVISEVFRLGYPLEIEINTYESPQEQETRGRKMKESAPQDKIENYVRILIRKGIKEEAGYAKYWHHKGRWENTANKNQIKKELIKKELVDGIDDSTIIRRIEKVLELIQHK